MAEEFSSPTFPCLPTYKFTLPNIIPTFSMPSFSVSGISFNITLGCPFDPAGIVQIDGPNIEYIITLPSVGLEIEFLP